MTIHTVKTYIIHCVSFLKKTLKNTEQKYTWGNIEEILPKGYYEVLDNLRNTQYYNAVEFHFRENGQRIEIRLMTNGRGHKYIALYLFSNTNVAKVYVDQDMENNCVLNGSLRRTLLIYDNENIFVAKTRGNTFYPANVSDFRYAPIEICELLLPRFSNGSMIWKDFISEKFFPPIKVNELSQYHNKKDFFEKQFGIELPNSVNKQSFLKTYAACCAKGYIKAEQLSYLLSDKEVKELYFIPNKHNKKHIAAQYLKMYLHQRHTNVNSDIISDYVDFSISLKEPIDILARKRKISEYHDMLTDRLIQKANHGKKLVIPETPLKYLTLPKEFSLLNTKKALAFEGKRNHNCVGAYVDFVNNGNCVIYTADINGEHLTIEICYKKSRNKNKKYDFYVNQCYTTYNKNCKQETLRYVKECVERSSDKAIEKYTAANSIK